MTRDTPWEQELAETGLTAWCFESSASTMDLARELSATLPDRGWGVVITKQQAAGRGRQGKPWIPPRSGFFATYIFIADRGADFLAGFSLAVGVATAEVLDTLGLKARLKWPNDLLLGADKKAGGILIESSTVLKSDNCLRTTVLMGIGINLSGEPASMPDSTSLETESGNEISQREMARLLGPALIRMWNQFSINGFKSFKERFHERAAFLNRSITLERAGAQERGVYQGVDDSGALLFSIDGRLNTRTSGEVINVRAAPC